MVSITSGAKGSDMSKAPLCGRRGLAQILGVSETQTKNLEAAGLIEPEMVIDGRYPLFSVAKAHALREKREAARTKASRRRLVPQADPPDAA
jgi:hypothetical protein